MRKLRLLAKSKIINYDLTVNSKISSVYEYDKSVMGKPYLEEFIKMLRRSELFLDTIEDNIGYNFFEEKEVRSETGVSTYFDKADLEVRCCDTFVLDCFKRAMEEGRDTDYYRRTFLIVDEGVAQSKKYFPILLQAVNKCEDCYLLIIGRKFEKCKTVSCNDIYRLKYDKSTDTYALVHSYNLEKSSKDVNLIICEDGTSGYRFYKQYFEKFGIPVISSYGNTRAAKILSILPNEIFRPYMIGDALALARFYSKVVNGLRRFCKGQESFKARLFAPESFECLVLNSKWLTGKDDYSKVFENPNPLGESDYATKVFPELPEECDKYPKELLDIDNNCTLHNCNETKVCEECFCFRKGKCACNKHVLGDKSDLILGSLVDYLPKVNSLDYTKEYGINMRTFSLIDRSFWLQINNILIAFYKGNKFTIHEICPDKDISEAFEVDRDTFIATYTCKEIGEYDARGVRRYLRDKYLNAGGTPT